LKFPGSHTEESEKAVEADVPLPAPSTGVGRRDLILLPLVSVLTVAVMFAVAEIGTRPLWPAYERGYCMLFDPIKGPHGKPNCTSIVKVPESPRVVIRFNSCGYRSNAPCGAKPAGTFRLAFLGSSITEGFVIPYDQMLAARMTASLRQIWNRPVEFQNLGAEACPPIYAYRHLGEALKLDPDAIVIVVNPWDLEQDIAPALLAMRSDLRPLNRVAPPIIHLTPLQVLQAWTHSSRSLAVAQHYLLENRQTFLSLYLGAGGDHTAFVRTPFSKAWEKRMEDADLLLGEMADRIHAAGIPFLLIGVPERAQAAMLKVPVLPPGVDPWAFTRRLSEIAARHGILYVDALKVFSHEPRPETLFYVVDGHPTPRAHELMGEAAARELLEEQHKTK
jgi:hypothetical protein